jgi:hypothetical protein
LAEVSVTIDHERAVRKYLKEGKNNTFKLVILILLCGLPQVQKYQINKIPRITSYNKTNEMN